jgi:hypothetical protein
MRRSGIIVLSLLVSSLVTGVSACATPSAGGAPTGAAGSVRPSGSAGASGSATVPPGPPLPPGWRWESYGGVQVGVPGEFGWGNSSQRLSQWCVGATRSRKPIVGRPDAATAVGCRGMTDKPRSETMVKNTGVVVALGADPAHRDGTVIEGDRLTVTLGGVDVIVQAPKGLREQIAGTVHRAPVDANGCPATHPISTDTGLRPRTPVALRTLTDVSAVAVCRYALDRANTPGHGLLASLRLSGPAGGTAIERIVAAPHGGGPDAPQQCSLDVAWGEEAVVLRVRSAAGDTEVFLRYAGCDHNGFDDGVDERALTAAATDMLLAGPHQQYSGVGGPDKSAVLHLGRMAG